MWVFQKFLITLKSIFHVYKTSYRNKSRCDEIVYNTWFTIINNKSKNCFINFHIVKFYPSISKLHVVSTINFAKIYSKSSDSETEPVYTSVSPYCATIKKIGSKTTDSNFYIATGSFHGAEICYFVGLFLLDKNH